MIVTTGGSTNAAANTGLVLYVDQALDRNGPSELTKIPNTLAKIK